MPKQKKFNECSIPQAVTIFQKKYLRVNRKTLVPRVIIFFAFFPSQEQKMEKNKKRMKEKLQ